MMTFLLQQDQLANFANKTNMDMGILSIFALSSLEIIKHRPLESGEDKRTSDSWAQILSEKHELSPPIPKLFKIEQMYFQTRSFNHHHSKHDQLVYTIWLGLHILIFIHINQ